MNLLVLLIVLILIFGGTGAYLGGPYLHGGIGLGGILFIILIVLLIRGEV